MIPPFVKVVLAFATLLAFGVSAYWMQHNARAGQAFAAAATWSIMNLLVWTGLIVYGWRVNQPHAGLLILFSVLKIAVLASGLAIFYVFKPLTQPILMAIVAGVSVVIVAGLLVTILGMLFGIDLTKAHPRPPLSNSGEVPPAESTPSEEKS